MIAECPICGEEELEGEFDIRPYGRGKLMIQVKTDCNNCDESAIYEEGFVRQ